MMCHNIKICWLHIAVSDGGFNSKQLNENTETQTAQVSPMYKIQCKDRMCTYKTGMKTKILLLTGMTEWIEQTHLMFNPKRSIIIYDFAIRRKSMQIVFTKT